MTMIMKAVDGKTVADATVNKQSLFQQLMLKRGGYENDFYLARILSSWLNGVGILPKHLGLQSVDFYRMVARHFAGDKGVAAFLHPSVMDRDRIPEWEDLVNLLREYRAGNDTSEEIVAQIIATACMGLDHLWQDLGLWSRQELGEVLALNFPELAARNNKNMKWKKFLYKQLCERDDTFVCRAPSCDVCADYQLCFGPEE